jgi:hypothetical protein
MLLKANDFGVVRVRREQGRRADQLTQSNVPAATAGLGRERRRVSVMKVGGFSGGQRSFVPHPVPIAVQPGAA